MLTEALKNAINTKLLAITFANYNGAAVAPTWIFDNDPTDTDSTYIRATLIIGATNQTSFGRGIGSRRLRKIGVIKLQIFTQLSIGSGLSDHIASEIEQEFPVVESGVVYRAVAPGPSGRSGDKEGWWQQNLDIPFWADRLG